jgi:hypothetical protein
MCHDGVHPTLKELLETSLDDLKTLIDALPSLASIQHIIQMSLFLADAIKSIFPENTDLQSHAKKVLGGIASKCLSSEWVDKNKIKVCDVNLNLCLFFSLLYQSKDPIIGMIVKLHIRNTNDMEPMDVIEYYAMDAFPKLLDVAQGVGENIETEEDFILLKDSTFAVFFQVLCLQFVTKSLAR